MFRVDEAGSSPQAAVASFVPVECSLAIGWSTFFRRPFPKQLRFPKLRYAYRAPAHVLERLTTNGGVLSVLRFDEHFGGDTLDSQLAGVDLLYLSTHGGQGSHGYETALTHEDWRISAGRLGHGGPRAVVFDTCDLVDTRSQDWPDFWKNAPFGPDLRLVLGFSSQATVSPETSCRGDAFGQLVLANEPLARAWLRAATGTIWPGLDKPIAIALGDSDEEARWFATSARLSDLRTPRAETQIHTFVLPEQDQP
jgi:hypothetical protein